MEPNNNVFRSYSLVYNPPDIPLNLPVSDRNRVVIQQFKKAVEAKYPDLDHPMAKLTFKQCDVKHIAIHIYDMWQRENLSADGTLINNSENIESYFEQLLKKTYKYFCQGLRMRYKTHEKNEPINKQDFQLSDRWVVPSLDLVTHKINATLCFLGENEEIKKFSYNACINDLYVLRQNIDRHDPDVFFFNLILKAKKRFGENTVGTTSDKEVVIESHTWRYIVRFTKPDDGTKCIITEGVGIIEQVINEVCGTIVLPRLLKSLNEFFTEPVFYNFYAKGQPGIVGIYAGRDGKYHLCFPRHHIATVNSQTTEEIIKEILQIRKERFELTCQDLKRDCGEENVVMDSDLVVWDREKFSVVPKLTHYQVFYVNHLGENCQDIVYYKVYLKKEDLLKRIKVYRIVERFSQLPGCEEHRLIHRGATVYANDYNKCLFISYDDQYYVFVLTTTRHGKKIVKSYFLNDLEQALLQAYKEYLEYQRECQERDLYEISLQVRSQTVAGKDVPKLLSEINPELLLDFYDQIHFKDSKHPSYYNPNELREGNQFYTPAEVKGYLTRLLTFLKEESEYEGVPKTPEERKCFYADIKAYLSQIISILNQNSIEPAVRKETIIAIAIAGKHCGARWMGEMIKHYNDLTGHSGESLKHYWLGFADKLKLSVVNLMVQEGSFPGTHAFIAMCQVLNQRAGIGLPAMDGAANYNDPYRDTALSGAKYQTDLEIIERFMKAFTSITLITFVRDLSNDLIKKGDKKFIGFLLEVLHHMIAEKVEADLHVKEALQPIEERMMLRKKQIFEAKELLPAAVEEKINRGIVKAEVTGSEFEKQQAIYANEAVDDLDFFKGDKLRIEKEYVNKMRGYRDRLLAEAAQERQGKVNELINAVRAREEYMTYDENGFPLELTRLGVVELLVYLELLIKNKI